ncbi:MAG: alpha/beta hydrolase [Leptonema sp. (in: Bacteria)]|nr:alpha/beta hydrolase [Leptonema sp. (in: bacteria)]
MIVLGRLVLAYRDFRHLCRFRKAGFYHRVVFFEGQRFSYYCERSSSGVDNRPTIVMLHGFLDRGFAFRNFLEPLKDRYKLIVIDLPGHGGSKLPPIRQLYTSQALVRSLYRFINSLCSRPVHLFTHSLGGLIGLQMQLYSQSIGTKQFLSLCAIAPGALLLPASEINKLRMRFFPQTTQEVKQLLLELQTSSTEQLPNFLLEGLLSRWSTVGFRYLSENAIERPTEVWLTPKQLKECKLPVSLIWGDSDQIVPLDQAKKLKQSLQSSKLFIIQGGGHALLSESSDVRSEIVRILDQHIESVN